MVDNNLLFLGLKANVLLLKQSKKIFCLLAVFKLWFPITKPC